MTGNEQRAKYKRNGHKNNQNNFYRCLDNPIFNVFHNPFLPYIKNNRYKKFAEINSGLFFCFCKNILSRHYPKHYRAANRALAFHCPARFTSFAFHLYFLPFRYLAFLPAFYAISLHIFLVKAG